MLEIFNVLTVLTNASSKGACRSFEAFRYKKQSFLIQLLTDYLNVVRESPSTLLLVQGHNKKTSSPLTAALKLNLFLFYVLFSPLVLHHLYCNQFDYTGWCLDGCSIVFHVI